MTPAASTTRSQAWATALLDPDAPLPPGLTARPGADLARRFAVYRNNVVAGRVERLAETFPVVRRLVGDHCFRAVAAGHAREHAPRSPVLALDGAGFADFIAGLAPLAALPWLADVARLEHARVVVAHAADAAPLPAAAAAARIAAAGGAVAALRVRLVPALAVVTSAHAVVSIWAAHQHEGEVERVDTATPESALVLRDADDAVLVLPVSRAAGAFAALLREGAPLGKAAEHAQAIAPDFDLPATLALLLSHGAVHDIPAEP